MKVSILSWLQDFVARSSLAIRFVFQDGSSKRYLLPERDICHAKILSILTNIQPPRNEGEEQHQNLYATSISNALFESIEKCVSINDFLNGSLSDLMRVGHYNFSQVCGVAGLWEFHLRILAARLEIDIHKSEGEKGRNHKDKLIFSDLDGVISSIKKKIPFTTLRISAVNNVRNQIVHGNFQRAREILTAQMSKIRKRGFEGNVISVSLDPTVGMKNLSEKMKYSDLRKQDVYAWFLEASQSKLFQETFYFIAEDLVKIKILLEISSISFGEADGSFIKLYGKGAKLNDKEIDGLQKNAETLGRSPKDIVGMVESLYSSAKSF